MTLWLVLALMTAAAVFAVLWPLGRRRAEAAGGSELAVYRDQLDEISRDLAAGRIGRAEAEAARIEIARRLLAADAAAAAARPPARLSPLTLRRAVALVALLLLPFGAGSLYLALGSPAVPGQPLAARLAPPLEQRSIETLVAQVEAHLERHPTDARGFEVLAPVYLRLGRLADAVKARRQVLALAEETPERWSGLGEALVAAAQGIVTAEAAAAFERSLALNAQDAKAQFFLGLAAEQDGRPREAAARWRALLAQAPPEAPWIGAVREALMRVEPAVSAAATDPSAADIAAAASLAPAEREAMVRAMVERLAARLADDGGNLDGWLRLIRAYVVLGEFDKARAAAAAARRALAAWPERLHRVEEAMKGLGLDG